MRYSLSLFDPLVTVQLVLAEFSNHGTLTKGGPKTTRFTR